MKGISYVLVILVAFVFCCGCGDAGRVQCCSHDPAPRSEVEPVEQRIDERTHANGIVRIRIADGGCGTGFIVGFDEQSRVATVFTCGHVVGKEKECRIEFNSQHADTSKNPTATAEVRFSAVDGTRDNAELGCVVPEGVDVHVFGIAAAFPDRGWSLGHPRCGWLVGVPVQRRQENFNGGIIPIAPAHHKGSSGSPVFDENGNVAGVVTFTTEDTKPAFSLIVPIGQFLSGPKTVSVTELPENVKRLGDLEKAKPKAASAKPAGEAKPTKATPRRKSALVPRSN
jgi:hypothetical protein